MAKKPTKRQARARGAKRKRATKKATKKKPSVAKKATVDEVQPELFPQETREEAIARLLTIAKAAETSDPSVAIQAQKEINKLQQFYLDKSAKTTDSAKLNEDMARVLKLIEGYVLPLTNTIIDPSYPLEEHVRVLADQVRQNL